MMKEGGCSKSGSGLWRRGTARPSTVVLVALALVLSGGLSVVVASVSGSTAAPVSTALSAGLGALQTRAAVSVPASPHPGTLEVDEVAPGGVDTVDPSVAYAEANLEPIMNVYETLVAYNGSSTSSFVPVAATCVPGTVQCTQDYGSGFTGVYNASGAPFPGANGQPTYWTFVIDPAAHFYDPATKVSWPVYPSDVLFSISRTVAFADLPGFGYQPGWMMAQTLLPNGSESWDGGIHYPFNNTPFDVLSSMFVNDSAYCPAAAMDGVHGDGCITFNASAEGVDWPAFLELVTNNLGSSIEPCGWFSAQDAGVPGFPGTTAANGDGSCLLPGDVTSTSDPAFQAYLTSTLTSAGLTSWDAFEELALNTPAIQPGVQDAMVGSGPYSASVDMATGYDLEPSAGYQQPSGCGGDPAQFPGQYTGYCDPAPGAYLDDVSVAWEPTDAPTVAGYQSGTLDLGQFYGSNYSAMVSLAEQGKLEIVQTLAPTIEQQSYVAYWNATDRAAAGLPGANNIPADFFSYEAARAVMQMTYPFAMIEATDWTDSGLQTMLPAGGPFPVDMGCYSAPTTTNGCTNSYTVPWPYEANNGIPSTNSSRPGTAGWWWAEGQNVSSPYYDPELAACTSSTPCTFSIQNLGSTYDAADAAWIASVEAITGGAIQPNVVDFGVVTEGVQGCGGPAAFQANGCAVYSSGWLADYPDPADQMAAYGLPNGWFAGSDAVDPQLSLPQFDDVATCGHASSNLTNLEYWAGVANSTAIPNACQGVAYHVFSWAMGLAAPMAGSPLRVLLYDLGQTIMNALDLYTWTGQAVNYVSAAPWIDPSSLTANPMYGGWDQFWFQLRYVTSTTTTFTAFAESGLAKGTSWTVSVNGQEFTSTKARIDVPESVGTYSYALVSASHAYMPTSRTGNFAVTSKPGTVKVAFVPVRSVVTFKESGLAKGTTWSVVVGTTTLSASTPRQSLTLLDGAYTYTATAAGYTNVRGTFVVSVPAPVSLKVVFTPYNHYGVTFNESGLAAGMLWSVSLKLEKGTGPLAAKPGSQKSTGTSISWTDLANGTYTYTAKSKGYQTVTGTVVIQGASVASEAVTFTRS